VPATGEEAVAGVPLRQGAAAQRREFTQLPASAFVRAAALNSNIST
jgi:hypothetical protein